MKLGVAKPVVMSFWNNLFGVATLISPLNSLLGEDVRITTFLEGGVLPGVVGRGGCGVSCFDGVAGFLTGVPPELSRVLGVVDCLASALRRRPLPRNPAKLGLPVSEAIV